MAQVRTEAGVTGERLDENPHPVIAPFLTVIASFLTVIARNEAIQRDGRRRLRMDCFVLLRKLAVLAMTKEGHCFVAAVLAMTGWERRFAGDEKGLFGQDGDGMFF